jgi:hypothetical protein
MVDIDYDTYPGTFNMGLDYYLGPGSWTTLYPTSSLSGAGFGPSINSATNHRIWEFAFDRTEISAPSDTLVRIGILTATNPVIETPTSFYTNFANLITVPLTAPIQPTIDGVVSSGEWDNAESIPINQGILMVKHDASYIYFLLDVTSDTIDDGTSDYYWFTFDVNENSLIDANVDINYGTYPGTFNMGLQYYLGPGSLTGASSTSSLSGAGFGPSMNSATDHRIWEFAFDRTEISAPSDTLVRIGIRNGTVGAPGIDTPPSFYYDFTNLIEIYLTCANWGGDLDGDRVCSNDDNCPTVYNPDQIIPTWYKDADNDGYSDGTTLTQCTRPVGYKLASELTATSGDCNDNDASIHPGATEVCDGVDNNCNGQTDEGVLITYYRDSDSDGLGDPNDSIQSCTQPTGYVADDTDYCPSDTDNDSDGDGYCVGTIFRSPKVGANDSCPSKYNLNQTDTDGDGLGDACDPCPDDPSNACITYPLPPTGGGKGGTTPPPDPCPNDTDDDSDTDGVCNGTTFDASQKVGANDNCPGVYNPNQANMDGDAYIANNLNTGGDACDHDADGDGYNSTTYSGNDCNDMNSNIHPGVPDISDGIDNDCDGLIDEDVPYRIELTLTDVSGQAINSQTWLPDIIGQQIRVSAKVMNNTTNPPSEMTGTIVNFSIPYVSNYPGRYTNDKSGIATPDFIYEPTDLANGDNALTLTVDDSGASIKITATATVASGPTITLDYKLPADLDNDGIADSWESRFGNLEPTAGSDNDGIKNIDEYRGSKWGKLNSCTDIKNQAFTDYTDGGLLTSLRTLCNRYQTEAYLYTNTRIIRTNPTRKDLFVKYSNFGTNAPFAIGAAYNGAGIDVHAVIDTEALILGNNNIDVVKVNLATVYPFHDGHILRKGIRNWEFDIPGSSCKGDNQRYGDDPWFGTDAAVAAGYTRCAPTGTNIYMSAINSYFSDKPHIDGGGSITADGDLDIITAVDDKNDDGIGTTTEMKIIAPTNSFDGDRMAVSSTCTAAETTAYGIYCTLHKDLSVVDIDKDENVELPLYSDPAQANAAAIASNEYTKEQVLKHVITHELGHVVGLVEISDSTSVMYQWTTDWKRDGILGAQPIVHNDNLYDRADE